MSSPSSAPKKQQKRKRKVKKDKLKYGTERLIAMPIWRRMWNK